MLKTKIVATIGPASDDPEILAAMIEAGVRVIRFNFSHGSHEEHRERIRTIRAVSAGAGQPIALMLDTKGPEIRTSVLKETINVVTGDIVELTIDDGDGSDGRIPVNYAGFLRNIRAGDKVLIDDGALELTVEEVGETAARCRVENDGEIASRKGINLPGREVDLPAITDKDREDILFAIEEDMDFIAASFVRNASHVQEIRDLLDAHQSKIQIIAKIESRAGMDNLEGILETADGVMVARGDLGVEIPIAEVPSVQKRIIKACNRYGKPVITATQMLDSMIRNRRPTRAEATDVANAILDGTDCVMLSGETAAGKYPVESVEMMAEIIAMTEPIIDPNRWLRMKSGPNTVTDAICRSAAAMAIELKAKTLLIPTTSGNTARMMARFRPAVPITAVSSDWRVVRQLCMTWGVECLHQTRKHGTDETIDGALHTAASSRHVDAGDLVIITAGTPVGVPNTTNLLKVEIVKRYEEA